MLKNNKPAAVVLSVSEYEKKNERIKRLEAIVKEEGLSMEELEVLAESVNIE